MLIPNTSPVFLPWEDNDPAPEWATIFGNDHPLALEIGCGVGDFVVQMATLHPNLNFIALDFYNKGCIKTCKRIDKSGLSNVRVLRAEARSFIDAYQPERFVVLNRSLEAHLTIDNHQIDFQTPWINWGSGLYF